MRRRGGGGEDAHPHELQTVICSASSPVPMAVLMKVHSVPPCLVRSDSSSAPSRMIASGNISLLNLGLTALIASAFLSRSPIFTTSRLSTSMNLIHHFQTALLCSCKPSKIVSTKLPPPACKFVNILRAHMRCSHGPCGGAWARNTFVFRGSELSCTTKTLLGCLHLYWKTPPITLLLPALGAVHGAPSKTPDVIFKRVSAFVRDHLHDTLVLIVLLPRLVVCLLQLRHHPEVDLLTEAH